MQEINSSNDKTAFDETLHALKSDPKSINAYITDLLQTQIKGIFNHELIYCTKIQALFPIISILFNDQTKVEIFVQIELNDPSSIDEDPFGFTIHGVSSILISSVVF